jgi:hypothetical protein
VGGGVSRKFQSRNGQGRRRKGHDVELILFPGAMEPKMSMS